jgi:D-arabinose 5-phosphate isomerase GutQ
MPVNRMGRHLLSQKESHSGVGARTPDSGADMAERKGTVLVTGSSGFIGSAIAARLADCFD